MGTIVLPPQSARFASGMSEVGKDRGGSRTVLNANSFFKVTDAKYPHKWPVEQFYEDVRSPGLQPLLYANVTDVTCYYDGLVPRNYLIMRIQIGNKQDPFGSLVWAQCERNTGSPNTAASSTIWEWEADDMINLSFERSRLVAENHQPVMKLAFDSLQVIHIAALLHVIRQVCPGYSIGSHDDSWFTSIVIRTLQVFGTQWTLQPSRHSIRDATGALYIANESSERVLRLFVQEWSTGNISDISPSTDQKAWSNGGLPRHQIRRVGPNLAPTFSTRPSSPAEVPPEHPPGSSHPQSQYEALQSGSLQGADAAVAFHSNDRATRKIPSSAANNLRYIDHRTQSSFDHRARPGIRVEETVDLVGANLLQEANLGRPPMEEKTKSLQELDRPIAGLVSAMGNLRMIPNTLSQNSAETVGPVFNSSIHIWPSKLSNSDELANSSNKETLKASFSSQDMVSAAGSPAIVNVRGSKPSSSSQWPEPFRTLNLLTQTSPTDYTSAALIDELRQSKDFEDLTGQFEHTHRSRVARGGYSEVHFTHWLGRTRTDFIPVCLKLLRPPISDRRTVVEEVRKIVKQLKREMRIWKNLRHPNIVKFIGFCVENDSYGANAALVSEWCGNGNAVEYLGRNPTADRSLLVADVAEGLLYLHSQSPTIVHADVKPLNVLINDRGHAQLCDFGLSWILDGLSSGHTTSVSGGTLRYLAPELMGGMDSNEKVPPTTKSDVFAFGCTCIQIFFKHQPYPRCRDDYAVMGALYRREAPRKWGDTPYDRLLASCCHPSSSDRPSMPDVVAKLSAHAPR